MSRLDKSTFRRVVRAARIAADERKDGSAAALGVANGHNEKIQKATDIASSALKALEAGSQLTPGGR